MFNAFGNDRPQILVKLEDCVLEAIIAISEGTLREDAMHALHSQISVLKKDLENDIDALSWFNLSMDSGVVDPTPQAIDSNVQAMQSTPQAIHSTPQASEFPFTPFSSTSL
jgi:hypothetical protein